jgi:hypothetical protein
LKAPKLIYETLGRSREQILTRLGAAERVMVTERTQMEPDYEAVAYAGMDDRDYPLWQTERIGDDWLFLHEVDLDDYGYDVDDVIDNQELPKSTTGDSDMGSVRYEVEFVDRFACRLFLRGHLKGASHELLLDILLRFNVLGYRRSGMLGYAGETLAEGYAFELEGRSKQAFFCYFSALESLLEVRRRAFNALQTPGADSIPENERLPEKLRLLVVAALPPGHPGLNRVSYWGWLKGRFARMERQRNAVAHNEPHDPITTADATDAFVVFAIAAAILHGAPADASGIIDWYNNYDPRRRPSPVRRRARPWRLV